MRLINVGSLAFKEFEDERELPSYGILSHRWEEEEITYQDAKQFGIQNLQKKGAEKIKACCRLVQQHNLEYVWVDTCCIDKSSSAELSEAINSMFRWYQLAHTCFAYLCDIQVGSPIESSVWFTRAWTLQELTAPRDVLFLSTDWQALGTKWDLADTITSRTRVPQDVLKYEADIYSLPVAQRMTWAYDRKCRRVEDIAYSLLGIFDINMPLLYGEGQKAFQRLQQEIIQQNHDISILLWESTARDTGKLLAPSPDSFKRKTTWSLDLTNVGSKPFTITNLGLSISAQLIPFYMNTYLVQLIKNELHSLLLLRRQPLSDRFERLPDSELLEKLLPQDRHSEFSGNPRVWYHEFQGLRDLFIALDSSSNFNNSTKLRSKENSLQALHRSFDDEFYGFSVSIEASNGKETIDMLPQCISSSFRNQSTKIFDVGFGNHPEGVKIYLPISPHLPVNLGAVMLGFDFDFRPCCVIATRVFVQLAEFDFSDETERAWFDASIPSSDGSSNSYGRLGHIRLYKEPEPKEEQDRSDESLSSLVCQLNHGLWLIKTQHKDSFRVALRLDESARCIEGYEIEASLKYGVVGKRSGWKFELLVTECDGTWCEASEEDHGNPVWPAARSERSERSASPVDLDELEMRLSQLRS